MTMTGLADCNNFFVSCERSVNPALNGKAVVVGSNNDGCVVARSNEAKKMGVKMGQPMFQLKQEIASGRLIALSGNHLLYRDISLRVHAIFRRFVPHALDYSVDESFLDVSGLPVSVLPELGNAICDACMLEERIPVTIGFASTKTLAKIVTERSKKSGERVGLLTDSNHKLSMLGQWPIGELWGVGRQLTKRMFRSGIYSALDFHNADRQWVRKNFGVNGERSWLELHDVACIELAHVERRLQDSISETRTFPEDVSDYDYLRARMAIYGADCARKLRAMNGVCRSVSVFLRTNRFHPEKGFHAPQFTVELPRPTDSTVAIVEAAVCGLGRIWSRDYEYKRAGVILSEITDKAAVTPSLFDGEETGGALPNLSPRLLKVLDSLNRDLKKPAVRLASQLTKGHPGHNDGYSSSFQAPSE